VAAETGVGILAKGGRSRAQPVSERQRQVLALVAQGLTTKEIAYQLGITERGVSAQVSRLLAKYQTPNRASLIARFIANQLGQPPTPHDTTEVATDQAMIAGLEQELASYENVPFFVGVTLGPDQVVVYQNRMSRDLTGAIQVRRPHREVFTGDASQDWWREKGNDAFTKGRPVTVASARSRWQSGDGTWAEGIFSCVAQPLRDRRANVRGILWICITAAG
jgi:DNA-binding CsgD family transcriptional regulator